MIMIIYFEVIQHSDLNSLLDILVCQESTIMFTHKTNIVANNHGNQKYSESYRNDFNT